MAEYELATELSPRDRRQPGIRRLEAIAEGLARHAFAINLGFGRIG